MICWLQLRLRAMSVKIVRQTSLEDKERLFFLSASTSTPHTLQTLIVLDRINRWQNSGNNFFALADSAICYYATACNHCIPPAQVVREVTRPPFPSLLGVWPTRLCTCMVRSPLPVSSSMRERRRAHYVIRMGSGEKRLPKLSLKHRKQLETGKKNNIAYALICAPAL